MIRCRLARPADIPACVKFIADHPVLGPRYGPTIDRLGEAWRHFLGSDALFSIVSEDGGLGSPRLICSQVASFISDEFATALVTPPIEWIGRALVDRCFRSPAPVLTDAEVRDANSTDGLNLLVWPTGPRPGFENLQELFAGSQAIFFDTYRGFNIKQLMTQATHPMEVAMAVNSGGRCVLETNSGHPQSFQEPPESMFLRPHMLEISREMAVQPGTWASLFFAYRRPTIGFTRNEQRLLSAALGGRTDGELADTLGVSLSAVKKTWASIYLRVQSRKPSNLAIQFDASIEGDRGKGKKQKLVGYLREHPEELKPYSLRLLESSLSVR